MGSRLGTVAYVANGLIPVGYASVHALNVSAGINGCADVVREPAGAMLLRIKPGPSPMEVSVAVVNLDAAIRVTEEERIFAEPTAPREGARVAALLIGRLSELARNGGAVLTVTDS